jgi:hypothetical protein
MSLPPAAAVSSLYDRLLRAALRHFFERATLDLEPATTVTTDGRFEIQHADPQTLGVQWFGTRYTLRVSPRWPFTRHEVRLATAIGAVLSARYRAILNPRIVAERGDLFRGAIEDRYVGAFLDPRPYTVEGGARADRIASIVELLRVAALSSYENSPISTGVVLLSDAADSSRATRPAREAGPTYADSLTAIKSFYRLADGVRTVFLANPDGRLLDIVDIGRWASAACGDAASDAPCAYAYQAHARATRNNGHVCAVLSPTREIKIFADGVQAFSLRGAAWHLLDVAAKYQLWADAVQNGPLAARIFQTALDLADRRDGALFAVLDDPDTAAAQLVAPLDRLDMPMPDGSSVDTPSRRHLMHLLEGRSATELDAAVLAAVASVGGATVVDRAGRLRAAGAILRHPPMDEFAPEGIIEGARTTAAMAASRFGPVLKVSEDGVITFFDGRRVWDV